MGPAKLAQYLKGKQYAVVARGVRSVAKAFLGQPLWARGYFCATVGAVDERTIQRYVEEQKWDDDGEGQFRIVAGR